MEIKLQFRQINFTMEKFQKFLAKNYPSDKVAEVKKLFLETFQRTEKTFYNTIDKPPDEVKPKYLQFFAKALNCKVDDILNQPIPTPKSIKL